MGIRLVNPTINDEKELRMYVSELSDKYDAEGTNGLCDAIQFNFFPHWLEWIKKYHSNTFLIVDDNNKIVGIVNIRYELDDDLKKCGGNIGYNIRPSERKKGYATQALELILEHAYEYGLDEVLIDCYKENIGSEKTILSSGAVFYSEEYSDERERFIRRFKLNLKEKFNEQSKKIV